MGSLNILPSALLVLVAVASYPRVAAQQCPAMLSWGAACKAPNNAESVVTDVDIANIVKLHNDYRRSVAKGQESRGSQPPASNMLELQWDQDLANAAQTLAQTCVLSREVSCNRKDSFQKMGQNNAWASGKITWEASIKMWYDEVSLYKYFGNPSCPIRKVCGRYTQVVWAATSRVGCGKAVTTGGSGTFVVCNYGEAGNNSGQKPYITGAAGSACPAGTINKDGLCG